MPTTQDHVMQVVTERLVDKFNWENHVDAIGRELELEDARLESLATIPIDEARAIVAAESNDCPNCHGKLKRGFDENGACWRCESCGECYPLSTDEVLEQLAAEQPQKYSLFGFPIIKCEHTVLLKESNEMISLADAVLEYRSEYGALEVVFNETNTIVKAWCVDWERPTLEQLAADAAEAERIEGAGEEMDDLERFDEQFQGGVA